MATNPSPSHAPSTLRVRSPSFPLEEVPRYWFGGNAIATHITNGVCALFPAGERFFVRSVHHYLGALEGDPELVAQVRAFCGQEGRHAQAHERALRVLRAQGYDVDTFLKIYEKIAFDGIEAALGPRLNLAVTAACEHYTALMAEGALAEDLLAGAHPVMRDLLLWHAAEEIEHKAVAFDVLARVAPGHALRLAGLGLATALLAGFWAAATLSLLAADAREGRAPSRADAAAVRRRPRSIARDVFWRGLRDYARRDFHPHDRDNLGLASAYLARAGLEPAHPAAAAALLKRSRRRPGTAAGGVFSARPGGARYSTRNCSPRPAPKRSVGPERSTSGKRNCVFRSTAELI
ncbi:MAG TPA: metal-dependent hydrolase [Polyangiaceae bacterium]|nr:metal-dependent hydrolase [Polyangiaceae bacterium]